MARGSKKLPCPLCGKVRWVAHGRPNKWCQQCRKDQTKADREAAQMSQAELALTGGQWVFDHRLRIHVYVRTDAA